MIKNIINSARLKFWAWLTVAILLLLVTKCAYAQNIGFEAGNLSNWTTSGNDAGISTGLINQTYGDNKYWTIRPYGTYMAQLYPSGSVTFDNATTSLGLTSGDNSAIRNFMSANAGGGSPTPTNATWIKRTVTLQAGVTYRFAWNFLATDYTPFNDGSMVTLVHTTDATKIPTLNNEQKRYALLGFTNPGTGNYSVGSYGSTGWQLAVFTVPADGNYVLGFATFNLGDTILSPMLFIDELQGTTELNGQSFAPISPNPGSSAPSSDSGPPTVVSTSVSNSVSTSSSSSNTSNVTVTRPTATGNYSDVYQGTTTVTTTTTTPVTTTTWSDGSTTTSNGQSTTTTDTTYSISSTPGVVPTYSRSAPNTNGNSIYVKQVYAGSNTQVTLEQSGNNNAITGTDSGWATVDGNNSVISVKQYGQANIVGLKMNAWGNNIDIKQQTSSSGDVNNNLFNLESTGNGNAVTVLQQTNNNTASVKLTLDINTVNLTQRTGTGNTSLININGYWNTVNNTQTGSNNFAIVNITGDHNTATVNQTGTGHSTLLNLINAGGANTVSVTQTGNADTYSLQQTCANAAGCSVSVTRSK